jgi:MFS family permease
MKKSPLLIIFLTVFIDLVGFGIVLPLLPIFADNLEASGFVIGLLMASYSATQFIFAPIWGRLSDRVGRRPILLLSTAGAAVSYAVFAVASGMTGGLALGLLFASRLLAGVCGANITVAQAYIADISPPEKRSARMGLIGMAFGLGFVFGPAIGALSLNFFGITGPGWVAAGFCGANFILASLILPESWKPDESNAPRRPRFSQWLHVLGQPKVGFLVGVFFLATFAFTSFETTLGLLVGHNFNLDLKNHDDLKTVAYLFAFCGIIGALVQGGVIGRAVKLLGEPGLLVLSLLLVAISLALLPFATTWTSLVLILALLAIGSGLARPPVFGMISLLTPTAEQGSTIGVAQGAGSLARIVGPIFAATLFVRHPAWPYLICAAVSLLAALLAWRVLGVRKRPLIDPAKNPEPAATESPMTRADPLPRRP